MLIVLADLARHGGGDWSFQFLASILDGFFEFLILRVDEIDPSQFSCAIELKFFHVTTFASPSAWRAFPLTSRALAIDDQAWTSAGFWSIYTRTTYIRLEVFFQ